MRTSEKIKQNRKRLGMTQTDLAQRLGLQKSAISKWENGQVINIKRPTLARLADIFGISVAQLLDDDDEYGIRRNEVGTMFSQLDEERQEQAIEYLQSLSEGRVFEAAAGPGRIGDGSPTDTVHLALRNDDIYVKVKGSSMEPTLLDGDIVVVSPTSVLEHPMQIALVKINGDESTIKRVDEKPNGLVLIGDNADVYPPHFFTEDEVRNLPITIEGIVTRIANRDLK